MTDDDVTPQGDTPGGVDNPRGDVGDQLFAGLEALGAAIAHPFIQTYQQLLAPFIRDLAAGFRSAWPDQHAEVRRKLAEEGIDLDELMAAVRRRMDK